MYLILDLLITFLAYTLLPFILFFKRKERIEFRKRKLIILLNSIAVSILFIQLRFYLNVENPIRSFAPAVLYYFINIGIWNDNGDKKNTFRNFNYKKLLIITASTILGISLITNVYLFKKLSDLEKTNEKITKKMETSSKNLNDLLNGYTELYIKRKINFFDNNIVFVIDGYGNYYSNYDCMMQRVGNSKFQFLAYNKEAAISEGYKEYRCE